MATKPKRKILRIIRRSCLTGHAVWVMQGRSSDTVRMHYWRACRKEIERFRKWASVVERRRSNIMRMISDMTAGLPAVGDIPPATAAALKELRRMAEREPDRDLSFYEHIVEERRRKNKRNTDYGK